MNDHFTDTFDPFDDFLQHHGILQHYGILRKSGRYPWGSGNTPYQRNHDFLSWVHELKDQGLSDGDIAALMTRTGETDSEKVTPAQVKALISIASTSNRKADIARAEQLRLKGLSNIEIGKAMDKNESSIRYLLQPGVKERAAQLENTASLFRERIGTDGILDVGRGVDAQLGIATSLKNTAIAQLVEEGYNKYWIPIDQATGKGVTTTMVLAAPGVGYPDARKRQGEIKPVNAWSDDNGSTIHKITPPVSIKPSRVDVRWGNEGGDKKDGIIELRRDVADISLGESRYAQVRIKVGEDHYLKGMAMYSDNMPPGVDVLFNTNKAKTSNKLDAMKPIKIDKSTGTEDERLPFGSIVRQKTYTDKKGNQQQSILNIVGTSKIDDDGEDISYSGEEGGWNRWAKTISSQMLSKQTHELAKDQLGLAYEQKRGDFDEIMAYSNPAVRKKLLNELADTSDSAARYLKAAGLPRTANHVILPINTLKDTEIYAPNYNNGERVVLIRHPHGGRFEIPELTVNNRNREANSLIKNAKDAVGINYKVAERLSGADFDGDTVLVIPNDKGRIKTSPALSQLRDFQPQIAYAGYEGMPVMKGKQQKMGDISNLITDMTIKGATQAELARAVKHSMVVIDAEKHKLNFKQSAIDNGIAELKKKYQYDPETGGMGASTLISKAKSEERVPQRKPRAAKDGGPIDIETGELKFTPTDKEFTITKENKRTGEVTTKIVKATTPSTKMDEAKDAHSLSSGTRMEGIYADHANKLKALANTARKEALKITPTPVEKSAREVYADEVRSLKDKLNVAKQNSPRERQAQVYAATLIKAKQESNPGMDKSELKKIKTQAITEARARIGAKKEPVTFTPREWEAVQSKAVSFSLLNEILMNADMDQVKSLATPRERPTMSSAKVSRAKSMLNLGYTQAEVADALGISTSTLSAALE